MSSFARTLARNKTRHIISDRNRRSRRAMARYEAQKGYASKIDHLHEKGIGEDVARA